MAEDACRRPPVWATREGLVAPWIYNKARVLLSRQEPPLFVPLRYVSLMAILYPQEWVFCDHIGGRTAASVWRAFEPHGRSSLEAPVPCRMDIFSPEGDAVLKRLPIEFSRGLDRALKKLSPVDGGRILPLWKIDDDKRN